MKKPYNLLRCIFPILRPAGLAQEWDANRYSLNDEDITPGMNRYPAMLVDSEESVTLAEWNWMTIPCAANGTNSGNHAYMLSTRRI